MQDIAFFITENSNLTTSSQLCQYKSFTCQHRHRFRSRSGCRWPPGHYRRQAQDHRPDRRQRGRGRGHVDRRQGGRRQGHRAHREVSRWRPDAD